MALPFQYNLRNLAVRRATNVMAALGIALVVMVMIWTLALAQGFQRALAGSGRADRALLMRGGASSEVESFVSREVAGIIETSPEIAADANGHKLASPELLVIINLPKRSDGSASNVSVRGVGPLAFTLRPELQIVEGRAFQAGTDEIVVGASLARRIRGVGVGERVRFGGQDWQVVGHFTAGGAVFESEVWGDVEIMMPAFERDGYQSMTAKLVGAGDLRALEERLEADPRVDLKVQSELGYYESQSRSVSTTLRVLGIVIASLMAFGAVAGALNTMYAAVRARTREIGTLLALGFSRSSVLAAFMAESVLLAIAGGILGCLLGSLVHGTSTGTTNWDSFSEVAFDFRVTPKILIAGLVFAVAMGAIGGFLPAARAARQKIAESLRAE